MPTRRIPSLNWLRVFEAAARARSFARAAEQLGMSSAAVSQQIKALETHFKKRLFTRGAHGIELTAAGRAFLPSVQRSLDTVEVSAAGLFGNPRREVLSLRCMQIFANGWLTSRLADFQTRNPHIHIRLSTYNDDSSSRNRDYDMEISYAVGPQYGEEGDRLFGETLFPVALPRISKQIESLQDLLLFRLISIDEHYIGWAQVLEYEAKLPLADAEFVFTDNSNTALCMAAAGLGIALARIPASDGLYQRLGLEPCLGSFSVPGSQHYYLNYPSRKGLSVAGKRFREWLLGQCSDLIPETGADADGDDPRTGL